MSSLLNELQKKKNTLTKVEPKEANSKVVSEEEQHKLLETFITKVRAADLENWYPQLKDFTYVSEFLPLSIEEAHAIVKAFQNKQTSDALSELEKKLDAIISSFKGHSAFVKLSSRSPKDATVAANKTKEIFKSLLEEEAAKQKTTIKELDDNTKVIALNRAHIMALKVSSGKEALQLLVASERINEDLLLALEDKANFNQKIIIREWMDIPIEYEFRGFIKDHNFTALSQYYHYCYFPNMVKDLAEIEKGIKSLYEQIKDIIPLKSLVLDFAFDPINKRALVIEINPFNDYEGCGTSAAMFNWKTDRKVLDEGPFEFRVETKPHPNLRTVLSESWKQFIAELD